MNTTPQRCPRLLLALLGAILSARVSPMVPFAASYVGSAFQSASTFGYASNTTRPYTSAAGAQLIGNTACERTALSHGTVLDLTTDFRIGLQLTYREFHNASDGFAVVIHADPRNGDALGGYGGHLGYEANDASSAAECGASGPGISNSFAIGVGFRPALIRQGFNGVFNPALDAPHDMTAAVNTTLRFFLFYDASLGALQLELAQVIPPNVNFGSAFYLPNGMTLVDVIGGTTATVSVTAGSSACCFAGLTLSRFSISSGISLPAPLMDLQFEGTGPSLTNSGSAPMTFAMKSPQPVGSVKTSTDRFGRSNAAVRMKASTTGTVSSCGGLISGTNPLPVGAASRTMAGWVRMLNRTVTAGNEEVVAWGSTAVGSMSSMMVLAPLQTPYLWASGVDLYGTASQGLADGTYHHMAITYQAYNATHGIASMFVDGAIVPPGVTFLSKLNTLSGTAVTVGYDPNYANCFGGGAGGGGDLDDVQVYNVTLTPEQIVELSLAHPVALPFPTPSITPTPSVTPSNSPSATVSRSFSSSITASPSSSGSVSGSVTASLTMFPSASVSKSGSVTSTAASTGEHALPGCGSRGRPPRLTCDWSTVPAAGLLFPPLGSCSCRWALVVAAGPWAQTAGLPSPGVCHCFASARVHRFGTLHSNAWPRARPRRLCPAPPDNITRCFSSHPVTLEPRSCTRTTLQAQAPSPRASQPAAAAASRHL